jgi:uncharacterized protein
MPHTLDELKILTRLAGIEAHAQNPDTARMTINYNRILDQNTVKGLVVIAKERKNGVEIHVDLKSGVKIKNPVHLCFGVLDKKASQKIKLRVNIGANSEIAIYGHCIFPNASDVFHHMDAKINVGAGSVYTYFEKHLHDDNGGVNILANAEIAVGAQARFATGFELLRGRVGRIEINYNAVGARESTIEMEARMNGFGDDVILINEAAELAGIDSRGVLKSRLAVRDNARAEVNNKLIASAKGCKGHVDCTEILRGKGTVKALPSVEVRHPQARVTHEARLGGVDNRQLETLMARGLTPREAEDVIIEGMLS